MDEKYFEVKKKHHHVWANYLKRWSADGINAFHTTKNRRIVSHGIRGIAMDMHFYKLTNLSEFDVNLIKLASSKSAPDQHKLHMDYLSDFLRFQEISAIYKSSALTHPDVDKSIAALESKMMENLHSSHERSVINIFEDLASGKLDTLYLKSNFLEFTIFIGHQFSRTKNFRDKVFLSLDRSTPELVQIADSMRNSWWFISYMLGMNIGRDLFLNRLDYTHTLLEAGGSLEFITSDQPVINIHEQVWREDYVTANHVDYYYPISPKYAYLAAESDRFPGGLISIGDGVVSELNKKIAARADSSIIGSSAEFIRPLLPFIGDKKSVTGTRR